MQIRQPRTIIETPSRLNRNMLLINRGMVVAVASVALVGCGETKKSDEKRVSPVIEQLSEDELAESLKTTNTDTVEEPDSNSAGLGPDATSTEVATAFARAFAEADPQTWCSLRWESDCDPADSEDLPPIPEMAPTGAREVLNNPPYSVVEVFKEYGHWCIVLIKSEEGWRVDKYNTPPPQEEC